MGLAAELLGDDAVELAAEVLERSVRLLDGAEEAARSRRCWRKRSPMDFDCLDMMAGLTSVSCGFELVI